MPVKKDEKKGIFKSIIESYKNGLDVNFPLKEKKSEKTINSKIEKSLKKENKKLEKKNKKTISVKKSTKKIINTKTSKIKSKVKNVVPKKLDKNSSLKDMHDKIKQQTNEIKVIPLQKHHIKLNSELEQKSETEKKQNVKELANKNLADKKSKIDIASIKEAVERELKTGKITNFQAEVKKQRLPLTKIVPQEKNTKISNQKFVKTGISGFDELFEHGIPKGNSVIVAGGAGSGKTIFCLQTLFNHAKEGKKCLYMSFEESEERLKQHMKDFGWDPEPLIKKGNLLIKRFNPFDITRSVDALLMKAKGELLIEVEPIIFPQGFRPDIVVLDSLTAIASAFVGKEDSYRIYIEQLFRFFEQVDATSLLITETEQVPKMFSSTGVEEFLADGVIVLYAIKRGNVRENAIEVLKMRGENHKKKIVALQINNNGIIVYPNQEVFEGTD